MQNRRNTLRMSLGESIANELGGGGAGASTGIVKTLPAGEKAVAERAYTDSLKIVWLFFVCIAAIGVAVSLTISKQTLNKQHEVQKTGLAEQEKDRQERKTRHKAKKLLKDSLTSSEKVKEEV